MSTAQQIGCEQREQIIAHAIAKKLHVVLTHRQGSGWRTFPSQFTAASPQQSLVAAVVLSGETVPELPRSGETLGATFRMGHKKCMFSCTVREVHHDGQGLRFTLAWPDHMQQLQRRVFERVAPPPGAVIAVRFWHARQATTESEGGRQVRHGQLEDLSAGGMRIKVAEAVDLEPGDTYECVFAPRSGAPALVLEAVLRHREAAERGRASLGFHFIGLETTAEGRRLLDRLARTVSQFQRAQPRSTP
ncbi:MAG: PilZ domain-containing protein [Planctomycetes bacterium]|nr:PilZ domain-containing protein [Planctomycetota bacterium]